MPHLIIAMLAQVLVVANMAGAVENGFDGRPTRQTAVLARTAGADSQAQSGLDTFLVKKYIIENYFRRLPPGALNMPWKGLDSIVDQWTTMVSKDQWKKMTDDHRGIARGRIGVTTEITPHGNLINTVVHWGPAYRTGLLVGDLIEGANDHSIAGMAHPESNKRIRGTPGTPVLLDVRRENVCLRIVTFRDDFLVIPVTVGVHSRTMGVRITEFDEGLDRAFAEITDGIDASAIDTIVFDVRDNPGGSLWEVENLLRHFIANDDTIVSFKNRTKQWAEVSYNPFGSPWSDPRIKILVLQDSGSASASELFAGALLVRREATIIGTKSYGKGRVQTVVPAKYILPDELADASDIGGVRVTSSTFHPGGTMDIDGVGVIPDVPLAPAESTVLPPAADMMHLRNEYAVPNKKVVDSLYAVGYRNYAEAVWGEMGSPFTAIHELERVRPSLPTPYWACTADHTVVPTRFTREQETELRRMLGQVRAGQLPDSVLRMEPLERVFDYLHESIQLLNGADLKFERASAAPIREDLGVRITVRGGGVYVTSVHPLTAAYLAGVCIGDRIMAIANVPISTEIAEANYQLLTVRQRGINTKLEIRRGRRQFALYLTNMQRQSANVLTHVEGGLGYIDMTHAGNTPGAAMTLMTAIRNVLDADAFDVVLDMRGAAGNNVDVAVRMLELFAKQNDTLLTVYRKGVLDKISVAERPGTYRGLRVTIMVDSSTRDAMEAFAGAMQRKGYATIIGTPTAGRTVDVQRINLSDGAMLVTSTEYITNPSPAGASILESMPVYPDRTIEWPNTSMESIQIISSEIRDILPWRTSYHMPTQTLLSEYLIKLRSFDYQRYAAPLAEVVWGDRGRIYNLMPLLAQVTGYK
jgi:carboxyl-terminal processing protease